MDKFVDTVNRKIFQCFFQRISNCLTSIKCINKAVLKACTYHHRVRKTVKEPLELKEACVRAAHEFIAEYGVERLSLREVARKLGVSHQAPYKHYPSRDHLLAEVIRRCFKDLAEYLGRGQLYAHTDPRHDLQALGKRYLAYTAAHPLEYRLMFGTPWPHIAEEAGLAQDAVHAFDVLRQALRRIYGDKPAMRKYIDQHAMFIWSTLHGLATITQSNVMAHLNLAPKVETGIAQYVFDMMGAAMSASAPPSP
jgi:AcrR family transcriptional regulator